MDSITWDSFIKGVILFTDKLLAKITPLNSMNNGCSSNDICNSGESEEHFDFDDSIDY